MIADSICTFVFSIIVAFTTVRILKDCVSVIMEGSPLDMNIDKIGIDLSNIVHVVQVHDLHVWSLSVGKVSLSCHMLSKNPQESLRVATNLLRKKYKITHATIQVEEFESKNDFCKQDLH